AQVQEFSFDGVDLVFLVQANRSNKQAAWVSVATGDVHWIDGPDAPCSLASAIASDGALVYSACRVSFGDIPFGLLRTDKRTGRSEYVALSFGQDDFAVAISGGQVYFANTGLARLESCGRSVQRLDLGKGISQIFLDEARAYLRTEIGIVAVP